MSAFRGTHPWLLPIVLVHGACAETRDEPGAFAPASETGAGTSVTVGGETGNATTTATATSGKEPGESASSGAPSGSTDPTSATASPDSGMTNDPSTPTTTDSPKFDLGGGLDVPRSLCDPDVEDCGCTAVDILFVIDNSGSMQQHADPVRGAFEPFVQDIVSILPPATSVHIGLTRATGFYDPGDAGGWNIGDCSIGMTAGVWNPPEVSNNGVNGQQGRLFEHAGLRYFELDTSRDPKPLADWFAGALAGAIDGWDPYSNTETPVAGAAYPFHPANEAFNAGFMRQQAVLVLFLLSDSADLTPPVIPTTNFIDMVRTAKSSCGDYCVVTTGAIADCYDRPGLSNTRLYDFMNGFGQPPASYVYFGTPIIDPSPDFTGVLGTALADIIGTTCQKIPPEG